MSEVKGTGWLSCLDFFKQNYGEEGITRVIASLAPDDQAALAKPILPVMWLDFGLFMRFMLAADKLLGQGDLDLVRKSSIHAAQKDLHGIYKIFISFTSPQFIIKNSGALWRQYYSRGRLVVEEQQEHSGRLKLTDFPEMPLHHEANHIPYMEECFRLSGGKNIHGSHPRCLARGDDACVFEFTWE